MPLSRLVKSIPARISALVLILGIAVACLCPRFSGLTARPPKRISPVSLTPFQLAVVTDLHRQCTARIWYQDGYFAGGDPPANIGVCTDVVIRSFRASGIDLQSLVQRDVAQNPEIYDIVRPDANIDHRRCRNLVVFFKRHAKELPTSGRNADWEPGDVVFWDTYGDGKADHVGLISDHVDDGGIPYVVHHWPGSYVSEVDALYEIPIACHFRYAPSSSVNRQAHKGISTVAPNLPI